jgi:outer membrane protein, multidrug efflux system
LIRSHRTVLLSAIIVSLAACRVGPNYHTPALPTGTEAPLVSLNTAAETETAPPDAWWRLYQDSRLDALMQEALHANRTLAAADANFAAARAALTAVHAGRYPSTARWRAVCMVVTPRPTRFWS